MKRIISLMLLLVVALLVLTSCGKFTCDLCGEEKSGKKYSFELPNKEGICCKECYEDVETFNDLLEQYKKNNK